MIPCQSQSNSGVHILPPDHTIIQRCTNELILVIKSVVLISINTALFYIVWFKSMRLVSITFTEPIYGRHVKVNYLKFNRFLHRIHDCLLGSNRFIAPQSRKLLMVMKGVVYRSQDIDNSRH